MSDYGMDFYLPSGGSSTGGLPTGWDSGTSTLDGGAISGGTSLTGTIFNANGITTGAPATMANPDILSGTKTALINAYNYVIAHGSDRGGDYDAYKRQLDLLKLLSNNPTSYRPSDLVLDPSKLGYTNIAGVSSMPADEAALLKEYGTNVAVGNPYNGTNFNGANTVTAYNAWLTDQKSQYDAAKAGSGVEPDAFTPKIGMPAGPPPGSTEEGDGLAMPQMLPYNPLKSDWKGSYGITDLSGFFGHSGGADWNSIKANSYDTPSFGGLSTQQGQKQGMLSGENQALFGWKRQDLTDTNKFKATDYLKDYGTTHGLLTAEVKQADTTQPTEETANPYIAQPNEYLKNYAESNKNNLAWQAYA